MSETSTNVPLKRLTRPLRFIKLIEGMRQGKTFLEIAKECNVSEKTIDRDFWEWKDSGGFDKWLLTEFMILHDREVQKGEEKGKDDSYRVVADLLKKRLREQVELQADVEYVLRWADDSEQEGISETI